MCGEGSIRKYPITSVASDDYQILVIIFYLLSLPLKYMAHQVR